MYTLYKRKVQQSLPAPGTRASSAEWRLEDGYHRVLLTYASSLHLAWALARSPYCVCQWRSHARLKPNGCFKTTNRSLSGSEIVPKWGSWTICWPSAFWGVLVHTPTVCLQLKELLVECSNRGYSLWKVTRDLPLFSTCSRIWYTRGSSVSPEFLDLITWTVHQTRAYLAHMGGGNFADETCTAHLSCENCLVPFQALTHVRCFFVNGPDDTLSFDYSSSNCQFFPFFFF